MPIYNVRVHWWARWPWQSYNEPKQLQDWSGRYDVASPEKALIKARRRVANRVLVPEDFLDEHAQFTVSLCPMQEIPTREED